MSRPRSNTFVLLLVAGTLACSSELPADEQAVTPAASADQASAALRLYVFDCG